MYHRVASFLLGCWILGSLFMMFVATENFGSVDRVLASAPPATIQAIGNEQARSVLRYMAGLENQLFFVTWERAQIVLSAALAAVFFFGLGSLLLSGLACALLLLTVVQHFWVTPVMIALVVAPGHSRIAEPVRHAARRLWDCRGAQAADRARHRGACCFRLGGPALEPRPSSSRSIILAERLQPPPDAQVHVCSDISRHSAHARQRACQPLRPAAPSARPAVPPPA